MLPFYFFQLKHKCTDMHNHTITHTHTHSHNTDTTFMPCDLARHYANGQTCHLPEISETERESETERGREILHICQFVRASSQVYSTVHARGTRNVAATDICNVLWCGGSRFWEKKKNKTCDLWDLMWNCSKEHAMFTVHCLHSWKASWKACSEPKQPKWVTLQDSC